VTLINPATLKYALEQLEKAGGDMIMGRVNIRLADGRMVSLIGVDILVAHDDSRPEMVLDVHDAELT